jgi:hypothetical protein
VPRRHRLCWCRASDENIIRILISTDNHVGYLERDPLRGNDSFVAFEEVLATARDKKVGPRVACAEGAAPPRAQLEPPHARCHVVRVLSRASRRWTSCCSRATSSTRASPAGTPSSGG